ncbi:hypothetical protein CHUAL_013312 [Chamberlinius hualienensis]
MLPKQSLLQLLRYGHSRKSAKTFSIYNNMSANNTTLRMVFTIFIHGERTPYDWTEDGHKLHEGLANLTKEGKRQSYEMGEKYRQQYKSFLSPDFNVNEVYVYSADTNCSLMATECCMAGLFPPTQQNKWHPTLNWQPVPIHVKSEKDDQLYPSIKLQAIQIDDLYNNYAKQHHPKWYQNYIDNKSTWKKWIDFTFKNDPMDLLKLMSAMDEIHFKIKKNLPHELPPNANFNHFMKMMLDLMVLIAETHPFYVNQGNELLTIIFDRIKGFINGSHQTKFIMYSLHNFNIWSLIRRLNVELNVLMCGGNLTFELHSLKDGKYCIRLQHCVDSSSEFSDIVLDGNSAFCPYEKFAELVKAAQQKTTTVE